MLLGSVSRTPTLETFPSLALIPHVVDIRDQPDWKNIRSILPRLARDTPNAKLTGIGIPATAGGVTIPAFNLVRLIRSY